MAAACARCAFAWAAIVPLLLLACTLPSNLAAADAGPTPQPGPPTPHATVPAPVDNPPDPPGLVVRRMPNSILYTGFGPETRLGVAGVSHVVENTVGAWNQRLPGRPSEAPSVDELPAPDGSRTVVPIARLVVLDAATKDRFAAARRAADRQELVLAVDFARRLDKLYRARLAGVRELLSPDDQAFMDALLKIADATDAAIRTIDKTEMPAWMDCQRERVAAALQAHAADLTPAQARRLLDSICTHPNRYGNPWGNLHCCLYYGLQHLNLDDLFTLDAAQRTRVQTLDFDYAVACDRLRAEYTAALAAAFASERAKLLALVTDAQDRADLEAIAAVADRIRADLETAYDQLLGSGSFASHVSADADVARKAQILEEYSRKLDAARETQKKLGAEYKHAWPDRFVRRLKGEDPRAEKLAGEDGF